MHTFFGEAGRGLTADKEAVTCVVALIVPDSQLWSCHLMILPLYHVSSQSAYRLDSKQNIGGDIQSMRLSCETVTPESKGELICFLKKNEEYSLFLLSNLETYGLKLSNALYSGNFKILRKANEIIAAFCLTKKGTLLVQSIEQNDLICEAIITACLEEKIPITGVLGKWEFAYALWNLLKQKKIIQKETFIEREVLYTLDVEKTTYLSEPGVRLLQPTDFDTWVKLRESYVEEMGFPRNTLEEIRAEFFQKVAQQITWGLFLEGKLVAIADLNARFSNLGQLGGVYTIPEFRNRKLSTRLTRHLIHDIKAIHHIRKLIIFTGENNFAARKVYESLGISPYGHYALLFGVHRMA
jgi:predicted GNAT family acetyltransferase